MPLDTQENLIKTVIDYSHRNDLGTKMDDFISLAETEMLSNPDEPLMLNEGEVTTELTASTATRELALPVGFQSSRNFSISIEDIIYRMEYRTPDQLVVRLHTGVPCYFTIVGNNIVFDTLPDEAYQVRVTYFSGFEPLTDDNQVNIVLSKYPNVYLFGCLRHVFVYAQDTEQEKKYTNEFISAIASANKTEKKARYGPTPQITVGWAP